MLQKLKGLSKRAKVGIAAGTAALAVLVAALVIWQPWKREAPPDGGQQTPGQDQVQPPEGGQDEHETPATLRVGNEEVPCILWERDGWSLYIPETWKEESAGEGAARFVSPEGAAVSVLRINELAEGAQPLAAGTYAALFTSGEEMSREFYTGDGESCWRVVCTAPASDWENCDALFRAIGRTGSLDGGKPFDAWSPMPAEPDWETLQGETVLFMDKDGVVLNSDAEKAVRAWMTGWPDEEKTLFTGKYNFHLNWCANYVGLTDRRYADVFQVDVSFELKEGAEGSLPLENGREIHDGWLYEGVTLYLTAVHDGSRVDECTALWSAAAPADSRFARELAEALAQTPAE